MSRRIYIIGREPTWLKALIQKGIVSVCESEPEAVLIFEKRAKVAEVIKMFQIRYIPIISQVKLDEIEGVFNLPPTKQENFLVTLLDALNYERERNPLTGLPGNEAINREIGFKILSQSSYWLCYADLNDFKFFNDRYGFEMGDRLIVQVARTIKDNTDNNFVGHIGGDDFVFIIPHNRIEILDSICQEFDDSLKFFYPEIDWHREEFNGIDRAGREYKFGFAHLSIVVLTKRYRNHHDLNYAAAYLKKISKQKSKFERRSLWISDSNFTIGHRDDLIRILKGNDRIAKRTAIEVLGEIGEPENFDLFLELLKDEDYLIRKSAVYALGKTGKPEVLPHILNALSDSSPHVRMRAAEALGYFRDDKIPPALLMMLNDPDIYVVSAAIKSIAVLKLKFAIPFLIKISDERIIPQILETLGILGDESGLEFIEDKLKNQNFVESAIEALGRIKSEKSLALLFGLIPNRDFSNYRRTIWRAIYNLSKSSQLKGMIYKNRDLIIEGLYSRTPYYQMMILHQIGETNTIVELIKFIRDRREFMRRAAVLYLSNNKRNLNLIGDALLKDPSPSIRQTAANVLVKFGSSALPYLRRALKDVDIQVRQASARSIMQILF